MLKQHAFKGKKAYKPLDPAAKYSAPNMSLGARPPEEKRFAVAAVASWRWRMAPPKKVAAPVDKESELGTVDERNKDTPLCKEHYKILCDTLTWFRNKHKSYEDYCAYWHERRTWDNPDKEGVLLDPFHRGLTCGLWSCEEMVIDEQLARMKAGKPLLTEDPNDHHFLVAHGAAQKVAAPVIEPSDSEDDQPLSKRQKGQKGPSSKGKKKKRPYATVGHYDGNGREWDEEFWTKEEYEAYKKRSDARIRADQAKMKLPNRGEPPDYVVGEQVFYRNACERVCVTRVWINKEAMDKDVQPVFRDASQIAVEYLQAASSDGNRDKINVKHYNHNAWYEVIWTAHDKFRQIVPQSFLQSQRGPREPRPMVTEQQSRGLPKPSEWHKFAAD